MLSRCCNIKFCEMDCGFKDKSNICKLFLPYGLFSTFTAIFFTHLCVVIYLFIVFFLHFYTERQHFNGSVSRFAFTCIHYVHVHASFIVPHFRESGGTLNFIRFSVCHSFCLSITRNLTMLISFDFVQL